MMRVAIALTASLLLGSASAQQADPALDALGTPQGPSELDILSEGDETDFPDIDEVTARRPVSVTLRALNKITAKYKDIEIDMGATSTFGSLEITARYCDRRPPEEFPETTAFIEVSDKSGEPRSNLKVPLPAAEPEHAAAPSVIDAADGAKKLPPGMIFSGWMFASSPALNALEHAVYDVWVIDCKTVNVES